MRFTRRVVPLIAALIAAGCASTGATWRSGVSDTFLRHAPWYAGKAERGDTGSVLYLPIVYQRGATQGAQFEPSGDATSPVADLVAGMNAYLDSVARTRQFVRGSTVPGTAPDVMFGCELDGIGDCTNGPAAPFDWGKPRMRLAVGRPSQDWAAALESALADAGATRAVVITLEVGQYWPQQTNWRGSKAVELGTRHVMSLPWLSSLETAVSVLQITGAVVGPDGRAQRIGAEGMIARKTSIIVAGIGGQALITEDDVAQLRTRRHEDRPGQPLVWQAAIDDLLNGLLPANGGHAAP